MSKHTPGPWKVIRRNGNERVVSVANSKGVVCTFPSSINRNAEYLDETARLIAVAPELAKLAASLVEIHEDSAAWEFMKNDVLTARALLARIKEGA